MSAFGEYSDADPCLADYFSDFNYIDRLTHFFLASFLIVVLVRLIRAPNAKLNICDAHLLDCVCQVSTLLLCFVTFRICRKENFNVQVPLTAVLITLLATITSFTFGISVGRSWGLAEAMLKGKDLIPSPSLNKSKRTIRPKGASTAVSPKHTSVTSFSVGHSHSSDDSSLVSQRSSSRRKGGDRSHADKSALPKSSILLSAEEEDRKKKLENEVVEVIFQAVESAKKNLLSNLELNLLPSGGSGSSRDGGVWKLVRTGYSSHIWLSKQKTAKIVSVPGEPQRTNNSIRIKASCFSVMSVTDVALFLHANKITTGLECITKHLTPLQTLKNKRVHVSRLAVGSALAVAKRDFVLATYWLEVPETRSVVICTQSVPHSFSPKVKGVTRGTIHNCGFVIIPAAKAPAVSRHHSAHSSSTASLPHPGNTGSKAERDIRCLISGQEPGGEAFCAKRESESGCQILYFADIDLGGSSGMAMRRTIASKGDSIINSLHALMDQLHRKVPGFHDSSFACSSLTWGSPDKEGEGGSSAAADSSHMPSALDVVFRAENEASGPGGLSHDQTNELRALSLQTSDRLKNLYCNAVGLLQHDEHSQSTQLKRTLSPPVMRKTSVAHRDDEFMNDVDYMESVITASDGVLRPTAATPPLSQQPSQWTTFHDQDGISVSEFCHSDYPMDTLMASCHVEANPHEVRRLLTESPEHVDGLLEQRDVLCRLDDRTSVQWIAYGAMWPIGARDFLVLTSEGTFNSERPFDEESDTFHDSFILVSTSVDSIYEDIIEARSQPDEDDGDQPTYTRSYLRLAGYIGTKNKVKGGTDLRLFINLDIATYIPAWVMQIMSQYGLSEMMNRIRTALSADKIADFRHMTQLGRSNASRLHARGAPSKLNTIMAQIQDREEKLLSQQAKAQQQLHSGKEKDKAGVVVAQVTSIGDGPAKGEEEENESSDVKKGKKLAARSLQLLKIYAGITPHRDHVFDWQVRSKKGPIEVSTSVTSDSSWIALRATTTIEHAGVEKLRNFLFEDSNLTSIDDMLDAVQPVLRVDANTSIRHMTFKGIWPTAPRDFVLCSSLFCDEESEGQTRSYVSSISAWEDLLPPQRGFVRGNLLISGYVIEEVEGSPHCARLTLCAHSELGGQLPSSIINALSVNAPIKVLTAISEILRSKQH